MAYTRTWDAAYEAYPAATDLVSEGDDRIRNLKTDTRERFAKDHYFDIAGTDADHGEHSKVTLRVGSAPTQAADKGMLYAKDVSSKAELFYRDEDGNEVQLTSGGKILVASGAKLVTFTHTGNVTGDQSITGVGFTPTNLLVIAKVDNVNWESSTGATDGTNQYCFSSYYLGGSNAYWDTCLINLQDYNTGTSYMQAVIKSLDSDGFTITWSVVSTPSAEPIVAYALCFK
jgi:hypothetical protein